MDSLYCSITLSDLFKINRPMLYLDSNLIVILQRRLALSGGSPTKRLNCDKIDKTLLRNIGLIEATSVCNVMIQID